VKFTTRRETCPLVTLNGLEILQAEDAKYLGPHLDRKLNWRKHIFTKRKQLGIQLGKTYWLLGSKSQLSIENKLLLYKAILKPIWTCGVQLWHGPQLKHRNTTKISKQIPQNTSPMTLYVIISTCHTLETRLKDSTRDTPIAWRNILRYSRLI